MIVLCRYAGSCTCGDYLILPTIPTFCRRHWRSICWPSENGDGHFRELWHLSEPYYHWFRFAINSTHELDLRGSFRKIANLVSKRSRRTYLPWTRWYLWLIHIASIQYSPTDLRLNWTSALYILGWILVTLPLQMTICERLSSFVFCIGLILTSLPCR